MPDRSMGKLACSSFQSSGQSSGEIEVAIRKIDTLLNEQGFSPPDVIKIDVEGAEVEVLNGAIHALTGFRPVVFLEAHSAALEHACSQLLRQAGYNVRKLGRGLIADEQARHLVCIPR
jgi:hypothetical protein